MSKYVASLKLMKSKHETKEMPYINLMPSLSMTLAYMEMYIKDTGIHYLLKKFVRWQSDRSRNETFCVNRNFSFVHFNDFLRQKNVGWWQNELPIQNANKGFVEMQKNQSQKEHIGVCGCLEESTENN